MALTEYVMTTSDVYNMDETGFRMGCVRGRNVITHIHTKSVYLADLDKRESITVLEYICADGSTIEPMLILKGEVLLETYFDDSLSDETLLVISPTGYTNEGLRIKWLIHFHNQTYSKCKGQYRILIFYGHRSHCSEEFLYYCW